MRRAQQASRPAMAGLLMLPRRVMKHVRDPNRVAVGLDFLIVVVVTGFIGIQVWNWNDALGDKVREREFYREGLVDAPALKAATHIRLKLRAGLIGQRAAALIDGIEAHIGMSGP